jgi:hypothetical protein
MSELPFVRSELILSLQERNATSGCLSAQATKARRMEDFCRDCSASSDTRHQLPLRLAGRVIFVTDYEALPCLPSQASIFSPFRRSDRPPGLHHHVPIVILTTCVQHQFLAIHDAPLYNLVVCQSFDCSSWHLVIRSSCPSTSKN